MRSYTDFIVVVGNVEMEFRHSARTVREFLQLDDAIIFDYYESQCVRKSDISVVRLNPRPFFQEYSLYSYSNTRPCTLPVNSWIHTLDPEERERILNEYSY